MNTSKTVLIIAGTVVLLAGGGLWLGASLGGGSSVPQNTSGIVSANQKTTNAPVKEFNRTVSNFAYQPSTVDVNLGDRVVINITNADNVTHGINLPAFGVAEFVAPGTTKRIEFLADKTGSPELFCSSDHGEKLLINVNG